MTVAVFGRQVGEEQRKGQTRQKEGETVQYMAIRRCRSCLIGILPLPGGRLVRPPR
jgi:hypothetical protein